MQSLKPTVFDDLIAMNALYRPGPMEYIPSFIARKHGDEDIEYDLPAMEEYLKETYGITVYQEQVMLLSQKLADFTKGEADILRKAMGKKQKAVLDKMKPKFIEQASAKGHDAEKLEKVWKDWEAFASYAFNKSHSTCYAWIAYQTAYLKAHYPAEYMAAVLSNNMSNIKQVTFFMEECRRMKLDVLGPDVNESFRKFSVNKEGAIRFGMAAIKGVGSSAVESIVAERKENGHFKSIFDMAKRIDLRAANKKAFENLALAGGFDSFQDTHRAQYFLDEGDGITFLEKVIRYAAKYQENKNSSQVSLFGEASEVQIPEPVVPPCEEWGTMEKLRKERDVVGMYISGHPLDDYNIEMKSFCNANLNYLEDLQQVLNAELSLACILTDIRHLTTKTNKGWAIFTAEDYHNTYEFKIYGEDYLKYRHLLIPNSFLYVKAFIREGFTNRQTGKKSDPRIQFNNFEMLQDVLERYARKLTIQINVNELKGDDIQSLKSILDEHKGDKLLNFIVYEMEDKVKLHMPSRKHKININKDLLSTLQSKAVHYKLN
jgi:DNA polymerase-3 subunit alpha